MARSGRAVRRSAEELTRPGPHGVLRGDLSLVGLPGVLFAPASGTGVPAVAFGHGWLQPTARYEDLLRHLASWGIVAAAPATERGALASHQQFANDLRAALDLCLGVRLGNGGITVDAARLGLAGHGTGGGCAVLAAAQDGRCRAVVTLAAAQTLPSAVEAARHCAMPALHLVAGQDRVAPAVANADLMAKAWAGPVQVRTLPKATHLGFLSGAHWSDLLVDGNPESSTRRASRALVTAFLLRHLADDTGCEEVLTGKALGTEVVLTRP